MDKLLYVVARALITLLQSLPLRWVARLGRLAGALAYWLDARHRRVTVRNLTLCFGREKSGAEIRAIAKENFRRIGENFASAAKTAAMTAEAVRPHVEFVGDPRIISPAGDAKTRSIIAAIGHFGNFELYARFSQFGSAFQCATTYRGLRQPALNRLLQSLRERSGCLYFERRHDGAALRTAMSQPGVLLGLLADQNAGRAGLRIPFFGHDCSTTAAPAVFALRYNCPLHTAICYRVGLAQWRIEVGPEIPTHEHGGPRTSEAIMRDVNRAYETAVRRDPANWFWVHNRWKQRKPKTAVRSPQSTVHSPQSPAGGGNAGRAGDAEEEE